MWCIKTDNSSANTSQERLARLDWDLRLPMPFAAWRRVDECQCQLAPWKGWIGMVNFSLQTVGGYEKIWNMMCAPFPWNPQIVYKMGIFFQLQRSFFRGVFFFWGGGGGVSTVNLFPMRWLPLRQWCWTHYPLRRASKFGFPELWRGGVGSKTMESGDLVAKKPGPTM